MTSKNHLYTFKGCKVILQKSTYRNNDTLAVLLNNVESGEDGFDCITVNLSSPFQTECSAFVDTNNLPGIDTWLEHNGIAAHTGICQQSGFCTYPLMVFSL